MTRARQLVGLLARARKEEGGGSVAGQQLSECVRTAAIQRERAEGCALQRQAGYVRACYVYTAGWVRFMVHNRGLQELHGREESGERGERRAFMSAARHPWAGAVQNMHFEPAHAHERIFTFIPGQQY